MMLFQDGSTDQRALDVLQKADSTVPEVSPRCFNYCFNENFSLNIADSKHTVERRIMNKARNVGAQIKHFRELAGLSKSDLARRVGVSPTAVHNWEENGVMPRMEVLFTLEKVLEVDFMQLWGRNRGVDSTRAAPAPGQPEVGRGDRLEQFRRQIAALFEVSPDRVDIIIRT